MGWQPLKSEKKFLLTLFIVAFILRALIFIFLISKKENAWMPYDSLQYFAIAKNIYMNNSMSLADGQPQMYRLPGYPIFLTFGLWLGNGNLNYALWAQIFLACFIPIFIFLLSVTLFPSKILLAKVVSSWATLHVGFLIFSSMVLTETLSLIFLLLFFIFLFSQRMLLAGIFLGITSLVRPIGHYLLIISIILFLIYSSDLWVTKIKKVCFFSGAWLLVVVPWLIRNFMLTGAIFFHTLPGIHFLQYSASHSIMEQRNLSFGDVQPLLLKEWEMDIEKKELELGRKINDYERCILAEKRAAYYLFKYPWSTIQTSVMEMSKTIVGLFTSLILLSDTQLWPEYTINTTLWVKIKRFLFPPTNNKLVIALIYFDIINLFILLFGLFLFMFAVMLSLIKKQYNLFTYLALVLLPYISLFIFITLGYGCARLRFPAEPLLMICSAAAYLWIIQSLRDKKVFICNE